MMNFPADVNDILEDVVLSLFYVAYIEKELNNIFGATKGNSK